VTGRAERLASDDDSLDSDSQIRRSVGRSLVNWGLALVSLAIIGAWASTGIYQLEPGEAGVILRLGERSRTDGDPGLKWHLPPPIETLEVINAAEIRKHSFGLRIKPPPAPSTPDLPDEKTPVAGEGTTTFENAMQTADSNIVNIGYVLQYQIGDPFAYLYGMKDPSETLFDATRSAVREVVGQMTIDEVLSSRRKEIEVQANESLRSRLDSYFSSVGAASAFDIGGVRLQVVQPPQQVQQAFDDVISARQDEERSVSEAQGDEREMVESAEAQAVELAQESAAYKESGILEAQGRASRFEALVTEYLAAPRVTRRRLYLETMEEVLPGIQKMIVEPGAASVIPLIGPGVSLGPPSSPSSPVRASTPFSAPRAAPPLDSSSSRSSAAPSAPERGSTPVAPASDGGQP
jgi:membrane protease subunit HflK